MPMVNRLFAMYWDRTAELSRDPVTGKQDFEGYRVYRSNPGDDRAGQHSRCSHSDRPV